MLSIKRAPRNRGSTRSPQAQSAVPSRRHPAQGLPHSFPASDTLLLLSSPRPSPAHRADDGVPAIHGQTYDDGLSQPFLSYQTVAVLQGHADLTGLHASPE